MLIQTGIPDKEAIEAVTPDETRFFKGRRCHRRVFSENPLQSLYKGLCKKMQSTSSRISTRHPKLILMSAMAAVPVC